MILIGRAWSVPSSATIVLVWLPFQPCPQMEIGSTEGGQPNGNDSFLGAG